MHVPFALHFFSQNAALYQFESQLKGNFQRSMQAGTSRPLSLHYHPLTHLYFQDRHAHTREQEAERKIQELMQALSTAEVIVRLQRVNILSTIICIYSQPQYAFTHNHNMYILTTIICMYSQYPHSAPSTLCRRVSERVASGLKVCRKKCKCWKLL